MIDFLKETKKLSEGMFFYKLHQNRTFITPQTFMFLQREIVFFKVKTKSLMASWHFLKVGLPPLKNNYFLLQWKPFRNNEKCFLFHLKSFLRSQDNWVFVLTFWACRKNGLIRKIRLISKSMTSLPG